MRLTTRARKNFVIFSLIGMLGLISYVNYSINRQALLETSSEFERYELAMMEENQGYHDLMEEATVFKEGKEDEEGPMAEGDNLERGPSEEGKDGDNKLDNAKIVDSRDNNRIRELVQDSNDEIAKTVTSKRLMASSAYFIEGRLERDKKRSEMVTNLDEIINNENASEEVRLEALNVRLNTVTNTDKEVFLENMIMAKGFEDAIVYLGDQSINIVVNSGDLTEKDVAQIVDIVRRETSIPMDNIIIMGKK